MKREHKLRRGRPSKLTPKTAAAIFKVFRQCGTIEDAASVAGVDRSTLERWKQLGREQESGPFFDFYEQIKRVEDERRVSREKAILKHVPKDWRAGAWMLERTEPARYAPRVRIHVEDELNAAIERLKAADLPPEALQRALAAIAGGTGREGTGADASDGEAPGSAAEHLDDALAAVSAVGEEGEPEV